MYKILIVEDDQNVILGLKDNLEAENFDVYTAIDGQTGLDLAIKESYDLILLDVMLPSVTGFEICKPIRSKNITTPIIMLTARGQEIDKVVGLEIGADDYITKPFSLRELIARVKALLRRSKGKVSTIEHFVFNDIKIDFSNYEAFKANKKIDLTLTELNILKHLIQHKDEVVSRDDLINLIWGTDSYVSTRTIDNHIVRLRKLLEKNPKKPMHFLTIRGVGYKFV